MGREIRKVPADWDHPKDENGDYKPLFDRSFLQEAREWLDRAVAWDNGTDPDCAEHKSTHPFFWQWGGDPPDPKYYRPDWPEESRTHFQIYETVSEGTPVTPHFATKAELVDYLAERGTFWDDGKGWDRSVAERFVELEYAPSMIIKEGQIYRPRDGGL